MQKFTVEDAKLLYGVSNWGAGYFDVSPKGGLQVLPTRSPGHTIDVREVVDHLVGEGLSLPILLRFPQILASQVRQLGGAFQHAIKEFGYQGSYRPVYPVKVNQQQAVVSEILAAGRQYHMGIEVGSKTELLVALAMDLPRDAFVVCNGFKDSEYIELALHGRLIGRKVIVVVERVAELVTLLELVDKLGVSPMVGLRMKLSARGSGKWEKSAGYISKFGLSTVQLLACVDMLEKANVARSLRLLHFHLGSQVPDIRRLKAAIKEAAIMYTRVAQKVPSVDILNVGGGLGVDYDGSRTASDASVNYSVQEFANDVIYTIKEVCESQDVKQPTVVTETGRVMTAYHSMLITDTLGAIRLSAEPTHQEVTEDPEPVGELEFIHRNVNAKNFQEFYHDAVEKHDELATLFKLGLCELESKARAETLFWAICRKVVRLAKAQKYVPEEFLDLEHMLAEKAICNFSVFQSVPDSWALDQLFPVVPVNYLDRRPDRPATLVDLTCDSDGEIDRFVDLKDIAQSLPLHDVTKLSPYYLAILLIGAYQEVLGDYHNLFGAVSEAHVVLDESDAPHVSMYRKAQSAREIVQSFGYDGTELEARYAAAVEAAQVEGSIDSGQAKTLVKGYSDRLDRSTYLAEARPPALVSVSAPQRRARVRTKRQPK